MAMAGDHSKGSKAKITGVMSTSGEQTREGAYYECTFCKMGFSNAQALGGHMNIHRRDRAGVQRPAPKDPTAEPETGAAGYGYLKGNNDATHCWSGNAFGSPPTTSWTNYAGYFPASSTSGGMDVRAAMMGSVDPYMSSGMPQELGLYGEELRLGLGIGGGGSYAAEEGEIDLELRLGR